jgi:hypothetical protein
VNATKLGVAAANKLAPKLLATDVASRDAWRIRAARQMRINLSNTDMPRLDRRHFFDAATDAFEARLQELLAIEDSPNKEKETETAP